MISSNPLDMATIPAAGTVDASPSTKKPSKKRLVQSSASPARPEPSPPHAATTPARPTEDKKEKTYNSSAADEPQEVAASPTGGESSKNILEKAMSGIGGIGDSVGNKFKMVGRAISKTLSLSNKDKHDDSKTNNGDEDADPHSAAAAGDNSKGEDAAAIAKKEKKEKKEKKARALEEQGGATADSIAPKKDKKEKKTATSGETAAVASGSGQHRESETGSVPSRGSTPALMTTSAHHASSGGYVAPSKGATFGGALATHQRRSSVSLAGNFDEEEPFTQNNSASAQDHYARQSRDRSFDRGGGVAAGLLRVQCRFLSSNNYNGHFILFYCCSAPDEIASSSSFSRGSILKSVVVAVLDQSLAQLSCLGSTPAAANASLKGIEERLAFLQGSCRELLLDADDAVLLFSSSSSSVDGNSPAAAGDGGEASKAMHRIMSDGKFAHVLPMFLSLASKSGNAGRSAGGCATLVDATGTFNVPICETRTDASGAFSGTSSLEVHCRLRPITSFTPSSESNNRSIISGVNNANSSSVSKRTQNLQTIETMESLADREREMKETYWSEVQSVRLQHQQEAKSMSHQIQGLELDVQRKIAEMKEVEHLGKKREQSLLQEIERMKKDLLERTALIMKLKKSTNPHEALSSSSPSSGVPAAGDHNSSANTTADSGLQRQAMAVDNSSNHTYATSSGSTAGVGNGAAGSSSATSSGPQIGAHEALMNVRRSIADGERFIEGMRKRAASPPNCTQGISSRSSTTTPSLKDGRNVHLVEHPHSMHTPNQQRYQQTAAAGAGSSVHFNRYTY